MPDGLAPPPWWPWDDDDDAPVPRGASCPAGSRSSRPATSAMCITASSKAAESPGFAVKGAKGGVVDRRRGVSVLVLTPKRTKERASAMGTRDSPVSSTISSSSSSSSSSSPSSSSASDSSWSSSSFSPRRSPAPSGRGTGPPLPSAPSRWAAPPFPLSPSPGPSLSSSLDSIAALGSPSSLSFSGPGDSSPPSSSPSCISSSSSSSSSKSPAPPPGGGTPRPKRSTSIGSSLPSMSQFPPRRLDGAWFLALLRGQ